MLRTNGSQGGTVRQSAEGAPVPAPAQDGRLLGNVAIDEVTREMLSEVTRTGASQPAPSVSPNLDDRLLAG
jgi:hypothetical protein